VSQVRDWYSPFAPKSIVVLTGIVLVLLLGLSVLLGREFVRKMHDLSIATTDNVQWNLTQNEVEHLHLQQSVFEALEGGDLGLVRRRFDIFYSRVATFHESRLFAELRSSKDGAATLARIQGRLDNFVPMIDGADQVLRQTLPAFSAELQENAQDVRKMTLLGLAAHTKSADIEREGMAATFQRLGWVVMALFSALALTALIIGRLYYQGKILAAASSATAARMQAMVTSSLDAILVIDTNGRIMSFNGAAESVFGYARTEAIGKKMVDLIVSDHLRSGQLEAMSRFMATGDAQFINRGRVRLEAKRKSGEVFPVELSVTLSHSGQDTVFVSYLRDISDRIAAEAELTRARDDALAGERAKANLLTVMSHEMRTPLSGVLGSMELLETTGMTAEQDSYLHAMRVSGELLLHHVNEVLELSQLEAGAASGQPRSFNLEELMVGLVDSQQAAARARGNSLSFRCRLKGQPNVLGRPRQIQKALLNLIGNALKFTRDGSVTVEVERQAASEQVEFLICDTGDGIAEADLERIFEDFVTLDASYGRISEGTGLGLAITRRIVDSLEGKIEAESELGEGSMFRVTLPLPVAKSDRKKAKLQPAQAQLSNHILVVEDNDVNRVLLTKTLQRLGHQVTAAAGGAEAVEATVEGQFDLILMDISMPGMDGTEAYRRIRAQNSAEGVDIVALTAHVAADDHARILETGFSDVATKPISRGELAALITRHTSAKIEPDFEPENSDIQQFIEALGAEKARGFLKTFCQDVTGFLGELQTAPIATKVQRQEAHRLAGSAAVLGLEPLRICMLSIEEAEQGAELALAPLSEAWSEAQKMLAPHLEPSS